MGESLEKVLASGVLRYSQVWEDHRLLERGLAVGPGDRVLSIASAGCNALALAMTGANVVALDLNPVQLFLVELKLAAVKSLARHEVLELLGLAPSERTDELLERLAPALSETAWGWWQAHRKLLRRGVHWQGRLETFIASFGDRVRRVHPDDVVLGMLDHDGGPEQRRYFEETFATDALKEAFLECFSEERLARDGRDTRQMRYVEGTVGEALWARFRFACTELPTRTNPYLWSFLRSRYPAWALPPYLTEEGFPKAKEAAGRITLVNSDLMRFLESEPVGAFSKANLSDVFEYMSVDESEALFATLGERLRPGGRIAYWNFLVPRQPEARGRARLTPLEPLSQELHGQDRSWFYRAFRVEEVAAP